VLSDGSLPGLAACAAAANDRTPGPHGRPPPAVWVFPGAGDAELCRAAAGRQADAYGLSVLDPGPVPRAGGAEALSGELLVAAQAARDARLDGVIWPVHAGPGPDPDLDTLAEAVDRALLVSHLASLGRLSRSVEVLTPYVDLIDEQIADIALDMDLPVWTCWWWGDAPGPDAARERDRWMPVLARQGWADRRAPATVRVASASVTSGAAPRRS
jgi:hypothetical protein